MTAVFSRRMIRNRSAYDLVVFDVDGVLIDTSRSFPMAAATAVRKQLEDVRIRCGDFPFVKEMGVIKTAPGFNNDWDTAAALCLYKIQQALLSPPAPLLPFLSELTGAGSRPPDLEGWVRSRPPSMAGHVSRLFNESRVRAAAMECYAGSSRCAALYGTDPVYGNERGTHTLERALADPSLLRSLEARKGIYTGRTDAELDLCLSKLGQERWNPRLVHCDGNAASRKPDPSPLLACIDETAASGIIFAGDSPDDAAALAAVKRARPGFPACFAAVGSNPGLYRDEEPECRVSSVNELLKFLTE